MYRLEFEHAAGRQVTDEEYRKIELVYMNTDAITGTDQIAGIYKKLGMEGINILYCHGENGFLHVNVRHEEVFHRKG